jgi:nucleoside-diphosphate-sugar epimerase
MRPVFREAMHAGCPYGHPFGHLHKPHVVTHTMQDFVDTNITGTMVLLEEAVAAGVGCFLYTSTTARSERH